MTEQQFNPLLAVLGQLNQTLGRINATMTQAETNLAALTTAVTNLTATVAQVVTALSGINTDNLTPDDETTFTTQINALTAANTALQAATNTPPDPTPAPAPPAGS